MSSTEGQFKRFEPPKIEVATSATATHYVQTNEKFESDFELSGLVAQQSGVAQLQKQRMQKEVQDLVDARIVEVSEQAKNEGYQKGLEEGKAKAYADFSQMLQERTLQFDKLMQELASLRESLSVAHEAQLISLIFKVAKSIALHEISIQPEMIKELVTDVIKDFQNEDKLQVLVSPEDHQFVSDNLQEIVKKFDTDAKIKVEADAKVQKGGCRILANMSAVDATIETRVQKAWELLSSKIPRVKDDRVQSE